MNPNHPSRKYPLTHHLEHIELEEVQDTPRPESYADWRNRMRQKEQHNATPRYNTPQAPQPPMQRYPLQQLTAWQVFAAYIGAHLLRPLATAAALAIIGTAALTAYLNFAKITAYLTW